jgi:hypothetical protein
MMFVNALWNYFFFRARNLFHAYFARMALQRDRALSFSLVAAARRSPGRLVFAALRSLPLLRECLGLPHLEAKSPCHEDARHLSCSPYRRNIDA